MTGEHYDTMGLDVAVRTATCTSGPHHGTCEPSVE
jgi:hypothetical protein